jgi:hypothetical protein
MTKTVKGDSNLIAGRDVIIHRSVEQLAGINKIDELFGATDTLFRQAVSSSGTIFKKNTAITFSSEALFSSLIVIGIPVGIAIEVPGQIIPLLKSLLESSDESLELTTNHIRSAVLQCLTGLQLHQDKVTAQEVTTWCSAYVRRYGSGTQFLRIIDNGREFELNYEYIKQTLLPHILERILGLERGEDAVDRFRNVFSSNTLESMATEILRIANTLNIYSIYYKTLYHLGRDIMLQPPHPWIVNTATKRMVLDYNVERAAFHFVAISKPVAEANPALFMSAARECCVHLCAGLLSFYGCFLGVESKYGLIELMRVIKLKLYNIPMWDHCRLCDFERDLQRTGKSLDGFHNFLQRVYMSLYHQPYNAVTFKRAKLNCEELLRATEKIINKEVVRSDHT